LIYKDAILENLFWAEPNIVRGNMGDHSSENCHSQHDKISSARLWASTLLRTIISKNLINDGNKKALTLLGHGQKKSPFGDLITALGVKV
jgi:hypothetical protein